jgi:TolB protein
MNEGRNWHSKLARVVAILGALAILVTAPAGARAAFNGNNGKIAFVTSRDGNLEIYSMSADGSGQTNLTNNAAGDIAPAWSADGAKIAFTSFRDGGNAEIYVMNSDGSGQTRLTDDPAVDSNPTWSPDGQKIAFRSDRSGDWEIYSMNADGSGQTNLTNSPGVDDRPAWSPDGSTIAFESGRDGNYEIYAMNANGTGQVDLTNDPATDRSPSWSPGGTKIAFDTSRDSNLEVYSMNADGTRPIDLSAAAGDDSEPAWSPDGTKIAFRSQRDGNAEIYSVTAANGTGQTRLTNNTFYDNRPNWQPVIPGFPRPKGATLIKTALAIAYTQCATGFNRAHGPPLVAPSCDPPVQASGNLTVGTLDVNGFPAGFSGFVTYTAHIGQAGPPDDSDVPINTTLVDVRCTSGVSTCEAGALSDYTGNLQLTTTIRITDKFNGLGPTGGAESATVADMALPAPVPCTATATTTGASCSLGSSVNALIPGAIKDAKRQILELGRIEVLDGGPDGDVSTLPNDLFAIEGLWVP